VGWKFFGPTADSGESAVGVCRGKSTADEIFEFVNGSFVVSFAFGSNGPFDSNLSVCSIQIFPDRSNRKGRGRKRDHKRAVHKFKNRICRGSAAVETLRNGSPENVWKRNIAMVLGPRPPRKSAVENFCGDSPDRPYCSSKITISRVNEGIAKKNGAI